MLSDLLYGDLAYGEPAGGLGAAVQKPADAEAPGDVGGAHESASQTSLASAW